MNFARSLDQEIVNTARVLCGASAKTICDMVVNQGFERKEVQLHIQRLMSSGALMVAKDWTVAAQEGSGVEGLRPDDATALKTLRDEFAMEALRGMADDCGLEYAEMAERCYKIADAMLVARSRLTRETQDGLRLTEPGFVEDKGERPT